MPWTSAGSSPHVAFAWMAFSPDADFDAFACTVGKGDSGFVGAFHGWGSGVGAFNRNRPFGKQCVR